MMNKKSFKKFLNFYLTQALYMKHEWSYIYQQGNAIYTQELYPVNFLCIVEQPLEDMIRSSLSHANALRVFHVGTT